MPIKTAVILAGGLGTRLRPLTYEIPKALIPIKGITLTEHVIAKLKEAGVKKVYLSIGHMADRIIEHFKTKELGVVICFLVEKEPLGTGGWMHLLTPEQKKQDFSEDFIVVNGDDLFDLSFEKMHNFHKTHKAMITIALAEVSDVSNYGVAELKGSQIKRFVEKPKPEEAPSHFISGGYYIFSKEVFAELPGQARFMFEKDVFPIVAQKGGLFGFIGDGQWMTTNTFEQWDFAIKNWRPR